MKPPDEWTRTLVKAAPHLAPVQAHFSEILFRAAQAEAYRAALEAAARKINEVANASAEATYLPSSGLWVRLLEKIVEDIRALPLPEVLQEEP